MTLEHHQADRERRLDELLLAYLKARQGGDLPCREEWLARDPDLAGELAAFFADEDHLEGLVAPLREDTSSLRGAPETTNGSDPGRTGPHVAQGPSSGTSSGPAAGPLPDIIPGYEILEILGRGGMGVVYRAHQKALKREVALKMILAGPHAGARELGRFHTEAEAVARLQHPNIVQIHDIGEHKGLPYFSLELVVGGSLAHKLAGTPQPARSSAELVRALAGAVDAAHARGIVHRDLKPANILLTADGTPKITDFGLAKLGADSGQTHTGQVMGTPSYMAPEQARGSTREVGAPADVYALGAILYECLTGRPPFKGADVRDTLDQVCSTEPVPPRQLQPKMPQDLETICLKCLEKDPKKRYASAAELAGRLQLFLENKPIPDRPVNQAERLWRWYKRHPVPATLAAVLLLSWLVGTPALVHYAIQARWQQAEAEKERDRARRQEYGATIQLTQLAKSNARVLDLLDGLRPGEGEEDLRGFEWHYLWRLHDRELFTLEGHTNSALTVAFHPDGLRLASGGYYPQALKVWDLTTGQEWSPSPRGFRYLVKGVAFHPSGKHLVTVGSYNEGEVWELSGCRKVFSLKGHTSEINGVAYSRDGNWLATASDDRTVKVWDAETGKELLTLPGHTGPVMGVAFSPDGRLLASGSKDGTVRLWDPTTGRALARFEEHVGGVTSVAFSPDGQRLASAGEDWIVYVRDRTAGGEASPFGPGRPIRGHRGSVTGVAFSPNKPWLATGSLDRSARIWDLRTGEEVLTFTRHVTGVTGVAFSPDGTCLACAVGPERGAYTGQPALVKLWDVADPIRKPTPLGQGTGKVTSVAFSPDGRRLASAGGDHTVAVWDVRGRKAIRTFKGHTGEVTSVTFSPDGELLASGSLDRSVVLWGAKTGKAVRTLKRHTDGVTAVAFSPDGRLLASGGLDRSVIVWDAMTGQPRHDLKRHTDGVTAVAFSPDGRWLVSGSRDRTVRLWDVTTWEDRVILEGHTGGVTAVAFGPDGKRLAVASNDYTVKVCALQTGEMEQEFIGHTNVVTGVAFSPDGERLISSSLDRSIKVWDLHTGRELLTLDRPPRGVGAVAVSPDGQWLASGSEDGAVTLWDGRPARRSKFTPWTLANN